MKQRWLVATLLIGVSYFVFSQSNERNNKDIFISLIDRGIIQKLTNSRDVGINVNGKNWDDSTTLSNVGLLASRNNAQIFGAMITARIKQDAKNNCGETTFMHYLRKISSPRAKEGIVFMARSLLLYWHL